MKEDKNKFIQIKAKNMKFSKVSLLFPIFLLIIIVHTYSQPIKELIKKETLQALTTEISGVKAKEFVTEISQYHRINGAYENTGYEKAVNYVMDMPPVFSTTLGATFR